MVTFDFNGEFEGSLSYSLRHPRFTRVRYTIDGDGTLNWAAKIGYLFESLEVREGIRVVSWALDPSYNSAMEDMINKEMKAVFGRAFFGKDDGSISSFQVLLVLENLDGIVSWDRLFGTDEAAKTIRQIFEDAQLAAVIQRIRNPGTYPSWKDYLDYEAMEQIKVIAEIQRICIRGANPYWKDFLDYEEYEAYKENVEEKSWRTHTIAHVGRESGGFVGGKRPGDTRTAELCMKQIPSEFSYYGYHTGPESDHDAGIQNPTDISKIICEDSVRDPLLFDCAVQRPGLSMTYAILCNVNLPTFERWTDVGSTMSRTMRNALKKVWSMQSGGPNIVSNVIGLLKNASKLAVGMVVIGNTPAVGAVRAMVPEAVEPGSLQTEDFEKSSNFAFGVVACVGTLVAIIALLKSCNFNWSRHHSLARASTASAPRGAILNRAVNMPSQTLTVVRSWRETEYREVVVARREE